MKKILLIILLLVALNVSGEDFPYQYKPVKIGDSRESVEALISKNKFEVIANNEKAITFFVTKGKSYSVSFTDDTDTINIIEVFLPITDLKQDFRTAIKTLGDEYGPMRVLFAYIAVWNKGDAYLLVQSGKFNGNVNSLRILISKKENKLFDEIDSKMSGYCFRNKDDNYPCTWEEARKTFGVDLSLTNCIEGNCVNGKGTYAYEDKSKYIGDWKDRKRHGKGTLIAPDGEKYVGDWKNDKSDGQGVLTFPDGAKYVGSFKDNKRNGQGTQTFLNGEKYIGEWKDDKHEGKGTETYSSGMKYVGEFKNSKRHGQGYVLSPDGKISQKGKWVDDNFVE